MSFINGMARMIRRSVSPRPSARRGPSRGRRSRPLHLELLEDRLCLSSWESIGPIGETVYSVAVDPSHPSTVYMGTDPAGVFKSTDGGGTWSEVNTGLTNLSIVHNSLAIDPHDPLTIYVGTQGGVFKTVDGAQHWYSTGLNTSLETLALDPNNSLTIYAATSNQRLTGPSLFESTNGGASWSAVDLGLPNRWIRGIAFDRHSDTVYVGASSDTPLSIGGEVLRSSDGGGTWTVITTGKDIRSLIVDPNDGNVILAGTGDRNQGGLFKTNDGGVSWSDVLAGRRVPGIAVDPNDSNTIYAATTGRGFFKTTDGGDSWSEIDAGLTGQQGLSLAIDPSDSNSVYAGTGGTIFKTTDAGDHWSASGTGLPHLRVFSLAIARHDPNTMYAGTQAGGVFRTTDRGATWSAASTGLTNLITQPIAIDPNNSNTLYVGAGGGGLFKSTDGGDNWSQLLPNRGSLAITVDPSDSDIIYADAETSLPPPAPSGLIRSSDGGVSWVTILTPAQVGAVQTIVFDPSDPATIYAGVGAGRVFKSRDSGANWSGVNIGTSTVVAAVAIDPRDQHIVYAGTRGGGVFKSTDGGLNWQPINTGLTNLNLNSLVMDPFHADTVYASTSGAGVFKSTDGGQTWSLFNMGIPSVNNVNTRLVIDSGDVIPRDVRIYAFTIGHSVFVRDIEPLAVVDSVQINDGSAQRSMVNSLTVTFSTVVTIDPGAFELLRQEGGSFDVNIATSIVAGHSVDTLTFSGTEIIGGSLADGHFTLTIHGGLVHDLFGQALDGAGTGVAGSDHVETFFRLFGDSNGDGHVDLQDLLCFAGSFGKKAGDPGYLWYFDYEGDGRVDFGDLLQFLLRFGP